MSTLDSIAKDIAHLRDTIRPGFGQYFSARLAYRVTKQEYDALLKEMHEQQLHRNSNNMTKPDKLFILGMKIEPTYEGVSSEDYYGDFDLRADLGRDRRRMGSGVVPAAKVVEPDTNGGGPT